MTKQEYLKQAKGLDLLIRANQEELAQLRDLSTSISAIDYSKIRVEESSTTDQASFTKVVEQILELEEKIQQDTETLMSTKRNIRESIETIPNTEERVVLQLRYLLGQTWEKISEEMNLSVATANRIHETAIKRLQVEGV